MLSDTIAFILNEEVSDYNLKLPFNPPINYPELSKFNFEIDQNNKIYQMVRESFIKLKMDEENLNTSNWNPFKDLVKEGDKVLIKPNLVKDFHHLGIRGVISQITHASVIRPVIDYILLALNGKGQIIIADTPLDKANFKNVLKINKISELCLFYKDYLNQEIKLYDLRTYKRKRTRGGSHPLKKIKLPGYSKGYLNINLKSQSELAVFDLQNPNYYTLADMKIDRFNPRSDRLCETNEFHSQNRHIYRISKLILESDVIVSIPKLKTHRMAGVTLNLKNMIGISEKIYLPHYRQGTPPRGDALPKLPPVKDIIKKKISSNVEKHFHQIREYLKKLPIISHILQPYYRLYYQKTFINADWWGAWYGNDTLWRTILDLNKIILFSDLHGNLNEEKQRRYFSIIDGIIAQEGEGPMSGEPRSGGIIISGLDPVACDSFASHLMGYDINKLKIIYKNRDVNKFKIGNYDLNKINIVSNIKKPLNLNLKFKLPKNYTIISR